MPNIYIRTKKTKDPEKINTFRDIVIHTDGSLKNNNGGIGIVMEGDIDMRLRGNLFHVMKPVQTELAAIGHAAEILRKAGVTGKSSPLD